MGPNIFPENGGGSWKEEIIFEDTKPQIKKLKKVTPRIMGSNRNGIFYRTSKLTLRRESPVISQVQLPSHSQVWIQDQIPAGTQVGGLDPIVTHHCSPVSLSHIWHDTLTEEEKESGPSTLVD